MRFNKHHNIREATFDLTAMIDVVLLLIIFFMLSSQFARVQLAPLALPLEPGEEYLGAAADKALIIDLAADGTTSIFDVGVISGDQLAGELEKHKQAAGGTLSGLEVLVRADRNCAAQHLNRLTAVLARSGVKIWKLATAGGGGA